MGVTGLAVPAKPRFGDRTRAARRTVSAMHLELIAVMALAAALDLWRLSQNGWANPFYSAAVRSMSMSRHNFLFNSLDPSGVMTTDKPPLALWIQTLAVKAFGFHPLSVLVPQAIMGVATVALIYDLVRRRFGRMAGFVAGLVLALTPMTVAISRDNNPDALVALCCVAALWFLVRGLERGGTGWIVLSAVCVGLGFETKFAIALVVVPGIVVAWLWVTPRGRLASLGQLCIAGTAGVAVAIAWPLVVMLTPANSRPWLGSTSNNSVLSLIAGYNGVGRLAGQVGGPSSIPAPQGGGGLFGGAPGPLRLLDTSLGGQAGWLVPLAVVSGIGLLVATRLRRGDPRTGWLLAVGGAFAAAAVVFSVASGIFHPYYVSLLAPFTAALVGAAAALALSARDRSPAVLAVLAGAVGEAIVIHNNPQQIGWAGPALIVGGLVLAVIVVALGHRRIRAAALAAALAGLLAAPAAWAVQTLGYPTSSGFPAGGPRGADSIPSPGTRARHHHRRHHKSARVRAQLDQVEIAQVLRYIRHHGGGTLGVRSQKEAEPAIIASGARIAGLGGYSGQESEPTVRWFADIVRANTVRWVLFNGHLHDVAGHRVGAKPVLRAVAATCRRIPARAYMHPLHFRGTRLYDCRGRARALERYGRLTPVSPFVASLVG